MLRWLLGTLGGLLTLVLLGLLLVQVPWGREKARRFAEDTIGEMLRGARVEIGSLSGSLLWNLSAEDVQVYVNDSLLLSIETLRGDYNLVKLAFDELDIGSLRIERPALTARQQPDSTWDILNVLPESEPADTAGPALRITVDDLNLNHGSVKMRFLDRSNSTVTVAEIGIAAERLRYGEKLAFEKLAVEAISSGSGFPSPLQLDVNAVLEDSRFSCDRCQLASLNSTLGINGFVNLQNGAEAGADLTVQVDKLALSDLTPFIPGLNDATVASGRAEIRGPLDSVGAIIDLNLGEAEISVAGTLVRKERTTFNLDADLVDVDPSAVLRNPPIAGNLNAFVTARLSGPSYRELSGEARLETSGSYLNGVRLENSDLQIDMVDGVASVSGSVVLPALEFEVAGSFIPLADTATWDLAGSVRGHALDETYSVIAGLKSVELAYRAGGSSASRAAYFRDLDVDVRRLVYSDVVVDSARLRVDRSDGGLVFNGRGHAASAVTSRTIGQFDLTGVVRFDQNITVGINQLAFERLDVGLGMDSLRPASRMEGQLKGDLEFPGDGTFSASVSGSASGRILAVEHTEIEVAAFLEDEELEFEGSLRTDSSSIDVDGKARPFEDGLPLTMNARMVNFDAPAVTGTPSMRSDLSGTMRIESRWNSLTAHRLSAEGELVRSSWNEQPIRRATFSAVSNNGAAQLRTELDTPRGGFDLQTQATFNDTSIAFQSIEGAFSQLDIGDLLGMERLSTRLNGSVRLADNGRGISGSVDLGESTVNESNIRSAQIAVEQLADTVSVDARARFETGRVKLGGKTLLDGDRRFIQGLIELDSVDVAGLSGMDEQDSIVSLGCSAAGSIGTLKTTDVSVLCLASNSRFGQVSIDEMQLEGRLRDETVSIDTLALRSNVADAHGGGTAYFGERPDSAPPNALSNLSVDVVINDLSRLKEVLGADALEGEGTLNLSITGRPGTPNIVVEPHLAFLSFNDNRVSSVDGYLEFDGLDFAEAQAVVDVGFSVFAGYPVRRMSISLLADPGAFIVASDITQREGRRASISATYDRSVDPPEVTIEDLTINVTGTVWRLSQEAVVQFGDTWEVQQFLIFHDDGQIAIDGYIDPDGEQNLILTAEAVETSSFVDLFGIEDLSGALDGFFILEGPADSLLAEASFRIQDLQAKGQRAGDLRIDAQYGSGRMELEGNIDHVSGGGARFSGSVPVNLTLAGEGTVEEQAPIDLSVAADSLPISWIEPLLAQPMISDLSGMLDAQFDITGTWDDPVLTGSGDILNGRVDLPEFKITLRGVEAYFSLDGDVLTLNRFTARSGSGTISGDGLVNVESLSNLGLDIYAKFKDFEAIDTETYRFVVTGSGQISGTVLAPEVTGDITVESGEVFMTEELLADEREAIQLTDRDLRILERRFGYRVASEDTTTADFVKAMKLEAEVSIGRNVWLRSSANPAMDIEFNGDLVVRKEPYEDNRVIGQISVNPARSRIIQFARRFRVERGTITFNGAIEDAVVDFRAEYVVPSRLGGSEVRILLDVTGVMEQPELEISSEPQMDDATMASYLLTGRPPGEATVAGEQAAEIAIGGVSRMVEAFANQNLGLDVVEIEASGTQGAQLTVGKYVSPKTYVFVKQPLNTESGLSMTSNGRSTQLGFEYELTRWLVAEVLSRRGSFRGNLRGQVSF